MNKRFYGISIGDIDFMEELTEENAKHLYFVHGTERITIWYLPLGHYWVTGNLPVQIQHKDKEHIGQILVRPLNSAVYWHVATISDGLLYTMTCNILAAENRLLLYFARRAPISDHRELNARIAKMRVDMGLEPPAPLQLQLRQIMTRLPKLCSACGEEFPELTAVPDEPEGVCDACFRVHYARCKDCEKVIPREEARYSGERILCASCHTWAKDLGFI